MEKTTHCNINKTQINKRKKVLIFALCIYIVSTVLVLLQSRQIFWYFTYFVSLYFAFINYYQISQKVCVGFAIRGIESQDESEQITKINDSEKNRLYRMDAFKIVLKSFVYAAAVTLLTFSVLYY